MKTPSRDLFELICSLKPMEKRYFKLYASQSGSGTNSYLKLFEVIAQQKEYDESVILKFFAKEPFINNFSVIKGYLYDMILKCLNSYHAELSKEIQLKELLKQVEVLYSKGLYSHCRKILTRAKTIAVKYEKQLSLLEILEWEGTLLIRENSSKSMKTDLEMLFEAEKNCLNLYKNQGKYRRLSYLAHALERQTPLMRSNDELAVHKSILDELDLADGADALSNHAKFRFYNAKGTYSLIKGDYQASYTYHKNFVELMESFSHFIYEMPTAYVAAVSNLIVSAGYLRQYENALYYIEKLMVIRQHPVFLKSEHIQSSIFQLYHEKLAIYTDIGAFEKGIAIIGEIEEAGKHLGKKLPPSNTHLFYFQFSILYFGIADYSKALKWVNQLLNDTNRELTPDLLCFARILQLILLWELKKYDVLEYVVLSTLHSLKKSKHLYQVESILLNFFQKKAINIHEEKQLINSFKELKEELLIIIKDPCEQKALEYFDFVSWLDSKIERRAFAEVVREKAIKT